MLPVTTIGVWNDTLAEEVVAADCRSGEVQCCQLPGERAVHLLRKRVRPVPRAQPGLDVDYRDALIEGRQGAGEARRGVALDYEPPQA